MKSFVSSMICIVMLAFSLSAHAQRDVGAYEFTLQIPYLESQTLDFDGRARAEIESDPGFGFGMAYNLTDRFSLIGNLSWNSTDYTALRVLDGGGIDQLSTELDSWNIGFGGDYYFLTGKFSPFINAGIGANYIDTNVPSGLPDTVCWWDPWYGYICAQDTPTHDEWSYFYSYGAGVRLDFGLSTFVKAGYYESVMDFDNASGSPKFTSWRLELGFKF